jgi:hypothetical protein
MRYVIIRDDDTNAFTPVECLERLYRPFLDKGFSVNLALIPEVATDTRTPDGRLEGFLVAKEQTSCRSVAIGDNSGLVQYLVDNPGYRIVQHGFHHHYFEFDHERRQEIVKALDEGTRLLTDAGFSKPETFVAPYDKLSRPSLEEVARRFRVLSTGWFELGRLPLTWWPKYILKKAVRAAHWRIGQTLLLSHPGCLLSYHRLSSPIVETIIEQLASQQLTVLVTHWWEYFRDQRADEEFIDVLHEIGNYLAGNKDIRVISFSDLVEHGLTLN